MDTTKFDDILMGMLQHCEQVEPFLDAMFSFLARRTDFFRVMHSRDEKMGFPPGVAEKIVLKVGDKACREKIQQTAVQMQLMYVLDGLHQQSKKPEIATWLFIENLTVMTAILRVAL